MGPPSCVTWVAAIAATGGRTRSRKGVRTDGSLCWEKVRLRAKWAMPRRGSDCGNLSGFFGYRGSVVVSYTTVSEP